jgi:alpha-ketoglutarate-dependent taurine dioxygenase
MGVSIRNLETLGSHIQGLDLSKSLAPDDRDAIQEALDGQLVVVARARPIMHRTQIKGVERIA